MKTEILLEILDSIAPCEMQESWDNSGVQILLNDNTEKILTALEITEDVVEEARSIKADMIITHHPLIMSGFEPLHSVSKDTPRGRYIIDLITSGISVYSSHTPFDITEGGNNDYLAEKIGLSGIEGFRNNDGTFEMIGRTGGFETPVTLGELSDILSVQLETDEIKMTGQRDEVIRKVGIVTGAGAGFIKLAYDNMCDVLITGDVKYHDAQNAKALGISVIDAGHFGTEKSFAENYADILKRKAGADSPLIYPSKVNIDPFNY